MTESGSSSGNDRDAPSAADSQIRRLIDALEPERLGTAAVMDLATLLVNKIDPALLGFSSGKFAEFLRHVGSSDPRARGPDGQLLGRWQDDLILQRVPEGASVLDLGCGDGELLAKIRETCGALVQGVELDAEAVLRCAARGVPVVQLDLDAGLEGVADASFDVVILEETVQTVARPDEVLRSMLRVGKLGFVSFPNFGYWRVRLDLALRGRMPVTEWMPHHWYDSPNIHLLTLQDFLDLARGLDVEVVDGYVLSEGEIRKLGPADNLYAEEALLVVRRAEAS